MAILLHPQNAEDEAAQFLARYNPTAGHGDMKLFLMEDPHLSKALAATDARQGQRLARCLAID